MKPNRGAAHFAFDEPTRSSGPAFGGLRTTQPEHAEHHGHPQHDWDSVYKSGTGFSAEPNGTLVKAVEGAAPGKALDVGMGQGRNAVFLATRGWSVTGVDLSSEGIAIAQRNAAAAKVPLTCVNADVSSFDFGTERYDLIALLYVGGAELSERVKTALKPGGLVVVEYFHKEMEEKFHHPMGAFGTGELEQLFSGFEIVRSEVVDDRADFGKEPAKLVRFVARKR